MGLVKTLRFFTLPSGEMRKLATPSKGYESIFEVSFKMFLTGKHLITDWDGVWVPQNGSPDSKTYEKLDEAVNSCKSVSVLSNCGVEREQYMKALLEPLKVKFFRAQPKKPHPAAFYRVFKALGLLFSDVQHNVVYIGDRFYSDVYGAKRANVGLVLLVSPRPANEPLGVRIARKLENIQYQKLVT